MIWQTFTWKGNKDKCNNSSPPTYDCMLGKTKKSAVPKMSRPLGKFTYLQDYGPEMKARPIKHWRKQLTPVDGTGCSTSGLGMPMDKPGGSVYLVDSSFCENSKDSAYLSTYIPKLPQHKSTSLKHNSSTLKHTCCNPETNIIKSAVTLLDKNYYTDSRAYLKSRCRTYNQRLNGTSLPENHDATTDAKKMYATHDENGIQVRYMNNCFKECDGKLKQLTTIYKPNNTQFAVQGAVSSSSRIDRLKFNTIQKSAHNQRTAWGAQSERAAAYRGKSDAPYYVKSKYSGNIKCSYHRNGNNTMCFRN